MAERGGAADFGRRAEAAAARYYQQRGCRLLAHNYRTRLGELDLVLLEEGGVLVIAEVKARAGYDTGWGSPGAAVGPAKQRRLIAAARQYLQTSPYRELPVRFDVVEVTPAPAGGFTVRCLRGAFEV